MKDQRNVKNNKRKDNVKTEDSVKTEDGEIIDDVHRRYSPCATKVDRDIQRQEIMLFFLKAV